MAQLAVAGADAAPGRHRGPANAVRRCRFCGGEYHPKKWCWVLRLSREEQAGDGGGADEGGPRGPPLRRALEADTARALLSCTDALDATGHGDLLLEPRGVRLVGALIEETLAANISGDGDFKLKGAP